ncbi:MAG TPA: cyclic nucleotide-binding domain-containing protein [Acidimicrobiales bacterium]|nr:cyclic nucleotide-binding domain-containing protein [Acidimicrobiales bacterium]
MRTEASITTISWIPSEAIAGTTKLPFQSGIAHYDPPPPDVVTDLEELRAADQFRFANQLSAWVEVKGGRITGYGQSGRGLIGSTTLKLGGRQVVFQAFPLPDICPAPRVTGEKVTFFHTSGGRTGAPAPRRVRRAPFVQFRAPLAWTTASLEIHMDGTVEHHLVGASTFPRHWVYDSEGKLIKKSGTIDFSAWYRTAFGRHSPWGDEDSPSLATQVETALERQLSLQLMAGARKPKVSRFDAGQLITEQGDAGDELFLVLDGVVRVEVDGERVGEYGPGSLHGERAFLEGGLRTSSVRAVTKCKLALARAAEVDRAALETLRTRHRREDQV